MKNVKDEAQSLISPTRLDKFPHARPPGGAQASTKMHKVQIHPQLLGNTAQCNEEDGMCKVSALIFTNYITPYNFLDLLISCMVSACLPELFLCSPLCASQNLVSLQLNNLVPVSEPFVLAVASTRNAPFYLHMVGSLLSSGIQLKCHYLRTSLTILSHSASYSAHLPST